MIATLFLLHIVYIIDDAYTLAWGLGHVVGPQLLETKITGITGADGRDVDNWSQSRTNPRAPVSLDRTLPRGGSQWHFV